ncbi:pyrroline-5-carboxylate reductase [Aspergillus ellipticus CBS 707.79]|uniref:Pyrroline-5-carboxylate reductase n=1 Tax=Aspergillus ellipticus CBS 707.79 TaxID=1448320 RepID=A0A319D6Q7_9EURO|nr:pyrroline-5-carboxylate reductase [Aspergillus ellipticus CBS 707.79]
MTTTAQSPSGTKPTTLAFIGCGNMGSAILSGLLTATRTQPGKITSFIVNTKTVASATKLRTQYAAEASRVTITHGENVPTMQQADVVLLACKPFLAAGILSAPGVREALEGKLVVSIMAGMTPGEILGCVYGDGDENRREGERGESSGSGKEEGQGKRPVIMRAMPNVAARLGESMTIIEVPEGMDEGSEMVGLVKWVFGVLGKTKVLGKDLFDVGTMLAGASMAVMTVSLEGVLDGCVAEGIRRAEALEMAAQAMVGMAALLRDGEHPALLRESMSSPRGCTIQGVLAVERAGVRGSFADAMIEGTRHLKKRA